VIEVCIGARTLCVLKLKFNVNKRITEIAQYAGADFVKTSTGFSTGGATPEDVILMRKAVGPRMGVKASGGIKDFETAAAMIAAGATRIGAGAGVAIVSDAEKLP